MLTQEYLKSILSYNPETGIFTWNKDIGRKIKAGDVAGGVECEGYITIGINNKIYKAHRLAWLYMTGKWPPNQIDHKKHIRNDNRFSQLRLATNEENGKNRSLNKNNTSGVSGVSWNVRDGIWQIQIRINKKRKNIGSFFDKFEAICCRKSAENKHGYHENHGRPAVGV